MKSIHLTAALDKWINYEFKIIDNSHNIDIIKIKDAIKEYLYDIQPVEFTLRKREELEIEIDDKIVIVEVADNFRGGIFEVVEDGIF